MDGTPRTRPRLSVVLPARDEEANVATTVLDVLARAAGHVSSLEVIVVDDGSRDRTAERVRAIAEVSGEVRLVSHGAPLGYGAALRSGFDAARYEFVFLTDADGQFPLVELPRALAALGTYDAVVGHRLSRADGLGRSILGAAWTELVRASTGLRARDVNCAFKLFPRHVLATRPLRSDGAAISAELLLAIDAASLKVLELGVSHRPRTAGTQTGASPLVALRALRELRRLARQTA